MWGPFSAPLPLRSVRHSWSRDSFTSYVTHYQKPSCLPAFITLTHTLIINREKKRHNNLRHTSRLCVAGQWAATFVATSGKIAR